MVEQLVNYRRGHDREGCRCSEFPFFLNHRWELRGAGRRLNSEEGPTRGRSGRDLLHSTVGRQIQRPMAGLHGRRSWWR